MTDSVITFVIPAPYSEELATMTIARDLVCKDIVLTPLQEEAVDNLCSRILQEH